jgi:hypothetical protein
MRQSVAEQGGQDSGTKQGLGAALLDQSPVMHHARHGDCMSQAVQALPGFTPSLSTVALFEVATSGMQQNERNETHCDEGSLADVPDDLGPI